jgi:uncharacterized protein YcbK (DUF882 family)
VVCDDLAITRRRVLRLAGAAGAAALGGRLAAAATGVPTRSLSFKHTHTGESLAVTYCDGGCYLPAELARIDAFLRDFRTGEIKPIEPALLDVLYDLRTVLGTRQPYQVISGYRSPATNERLRQESGGVARHSLHMAGRAIDVRLGDVPTAEVRDAALAVAGGGVGFYGHLDFVHLDTGRVRRW